jgi:hypothetical protein
MKHTLVTGIVVALVAAAVALFGGALGITTVWPVLLAVAVGIAAGAPTVGRVSAYLVGAVLSLVALAVRANFFPDLPLPRAVAVGAAVLVIALIAGVTRDRMALWAGLAGYAAFAALYEPQFAASPTAFLTQAPVALLVVVIGGALGVLAAQLAALLTGGVPGYEYERADALDDDGFAIAGEGAR